MFRDVWKAVALAVNYAMFNDIATEALFSWQVWPAQGLGYSSVEAVPATEALASWQVWAGVGDVRTWLRFGANQRGTAGG